MKINNSNNDSLSMLPVDINPIEMNENSYQSYDENNFFNKKDLKQANKDKILEIFF